MCNFMFMTCTLTYFPMKTFIMVEDVKVNDPKTSGGLRNWMGQLT